MYDLQKHNRMNRLDKLSLYDKKYIIVKPLQHTSKVMEKLKSTYMCNHNGSTYIRIFRNNQKQKRNSYMTKSSYCNTLPTTFTFDHEAPLKFYHNFSLLFFKHIVFIYLFKTYQAFVMLNCFHDWLQVILLILLWTFADKFSFHKIVRGNTK